MNPSDMIQFGVVTGGIALSTVLLGLGLVAISFRRLKMRQRKVTLNALSTEMQKVWATAQPWPPPAPKNHERVTPRRAQQRPLTESEVEALIYDTPPGKRTPRLGIAVEFEPADIGITPFLQAWERTVPKRISRK